MMQYISYRERGKKASVNTEHSCQKPLFYLLKLWVNLAMLGELKKKKIERTDRTEREIEREERRTREKTIKTAVVLRNSGKIKDNSPFFLFLT